MSVSQKIMVSVSSDLTTDQRVQKVCASLANHGFEVQVLGRELPDSSTFSNELYKSKRFKLWFKKGFLFYVNLNVALFIKLIFSKLDVLYANDLDTLPANYLVSNIKGVPLIYDSHEYFTEVPELVNRPSVRRVWQKIEKAILPNLKNCITVTTLIAETYNKSYGLDFRVMRNFPNRIEHQIPAKENYILYQGALNVGRGLEELIAAMPEVNADLWIAGGGDIEEELKVLVHELGLQNKIQFLGRLDPEELRKYTLRAKIGVSLEHKMGLNYTFALPNKIFDYLHCQTPVLYADLVEVKKLFGEVKVGQELIGYAPQTMGHQINAMLVSEDYREWQSNCERLSKKFTWQEEEKVLITMLQTC